MIESNRKHSPKSLLALLGELAAFSRREPFIVLLVVVVILRISLVLITIHFPEGAKLVDSTGYLDAAETLVEDGSYVERKWPPAYPLFIALASGWSTPSFVWTVLVQLVLTSATALMLVPIGTRLISKRAGVVAGWLYALSPNTSLWALTIMTETLYACILAATLWVWLVASQGSRRSNFLMVGLLLGLGAMVRNIALFVIPIWIAFGFILTGRNKDWSKALEVMVLVTIGAMLLVLPWSARNLVVNGEFALTVEASRTFFAFNIARVLAEVDGVSRAEAAATFALAENPAALTVNLFRDYPVIFLRVQLEGILRSMFGVATGAWARVLAYPLELQGSLNLLSNLISSNFNIVVDRLRDLIQSRETMILLVLTLIGFTHTLMLYVLGLAAIKCRGDCRWILVLLVVTGAYLLVVPGAGGQARFRIPIEPILAVLAGVGAFYLQE